MSSNNIFLKISNDKYFFLESKNLELKDKYNDIYYMNYIDNINKLLIKNNNINEYSNNKISYTYNDLINIIKLKFSTENMLKYFGNKNDLDGKETRDIYKNLIDYFINLFLYKIEIITNIKVDNIDDNDNPYICLVAECLNIIRASIKKYVRLRTSDTQIYFCKKNYLEKRNRDDYKCSVPVKEFEYCPSFKYLREEKKKTCREIIKSALSPNNLYNFFSPLCLLPVRKVKTIKIQKEGSRYTKQKGTRKIYRGMPIVLKKYKKKTLKKSKSKSKTNHNNHNNTINNVNLNNDNINNININNLKINSNNE